MIVTAVMLVSCVMMPRDYVGKWTFAQQDKLGRVVQTYDLRDDGTFTLEKRLVSPALHTVHVSIEGEWRIEELDDHMMLTMRYHPESFRSDEEGGTPSELAEFNRWNSDMDAAAELGQIYGWPVLRVKGSTMLLGHPGHTIRLTRLRH